MTTEEAIALVATKGRRLEIRAWKVLADGAIDWDIKLWLQIPQGRSRQHQHP